VRLRPIITTIDSILGLMKDYTQADDIPRDAKPVKLMLNPREKNRIAILVESDEWVGPQKPIMIKFDIRRMYGVGSGQ